MGKDSEKGKYTSPEGSKLWEYLSAFFCALGCGCCGTMIGWISPSLAELTAPNSPIAMSPDEASTVAATMSIGQGIAPLLSIVLLDKIGRRKTILVSTVPMIVSWGMIFLAEHVTVLIIARTLAGFSVGLMIMTLPMFGGEILSAGIRGSMIAVNYIACSLGILFMFSIAPFLGVRLTACVCLTFTIIFLVCIWFVPESPYFLAMVGRIDEAEAALEKLRGRTDVAHEFELIKATIQEKGKALIKSSNNEKEEDPITQSAIRKLFTIRGNLKALFLALVLATLQGLCGFNIILSYCHLILHDIGSSLDVYIAALICMGLQIVANICMVVIVDRFDRRHILFITGTISGILTTILAVYFYLIEYKDIDIKQYEAVPLFSIFTLIVTLNLGVVGIPGIIMSEIFSTDVKVLGNCSFGVWGALTSGLVAKFHLLIALAWGWGHTVPFFVYAISTFICLAILARWLPETKGDTLLEIQKKLNA